MKKIISIVIVTYKSEDYIENCLKSILEHNDYSNNEIEIIIVDNSPLEDFEKLKLLIPENYPIFIKMIHNNSNGGFGQGNNIGFKHSNSEVVLFMNPDVLLKSKIFKEAINSFKNNNNLCILGGKQLGHKDISFYFRQEYDFFPFTTSVMLLLNKLNIYIEKFMFLSGAFLFVNKSNFEDIGSFDENIFLYSEESDITIRALRKSYKTKFDKNLIYHHLVDGRKPSEYSINEAIKSNIYYFNKYDFNIKNYFKRKIFGYKLMSLIFSNNKSKKQDFINNIRLYKEKLDNLNK